MHQGIVAALDDFIEALSFLLLVVVAGWGFGEGGFWEFAHLG
jgi:hypothetical protein